MELKNHVKVKSKLVSIWSIILFTVLNSCNALCQDKIILDAYRFPEPTVDLLIDWSNMSTSEWQEKFNQYDWKKCDWSNSCLECWRNVSEGSVLMGKCAGGKMILDWSYFMGNGKRTTLYERLYSQIEPFYVGSDDMGDNFVFKHRGYVCSILVGRNGRSNIYVFTKTPVKN